MARRLPALLWALACAFAFFAVVTVVFRPPGATGLLAAIDFGGAVAAAVAARYASRRVVRRANAVAGAAFLVTLAASLVALSLLHRASQTTNLLILDLVAGVTLLSAPWLAVILALSLAGFAVVATSEGFGIDWLNAGFALVVATVMAGTMQFIRLRDARQTEELSFSNEEKQRELEAAVERERSHARALASANDSLEAFSYVIAHDLKEPIRGTRAYLEALSDEPDAPDRVELVQGAIESHERLSRLVSGLLDWSRVNAGPVELAPVTVQDVLADATTRAQFEPAMRDRSAKLLIDPEVPPVLASAALLRQILGNLVLNAIRHNPRPDPQVRVYASAHAPIGWVEIVVEDNGPGFPEHLLARHGGASDAPTSVRSGFGLEIARRAAERLGGSFRVENPAGGGARVRVALPAALPVADDEARLVRATRR